MHFRNCVAVLLTMSVAHAAEFLSPDRQNALVRKYCAVCHTDAAKNGGLSLEYYDAAQPDPPLAAMLLSKLKGGAMGAAGLGIPDKPTQEAWMAATATQAEGAGKWAFIGSAESGLKSASIVRGVTSRVYRLTLTACGQTQLTWSPQPQVDRAFVVSVDGGAGIPHRLEGREQKMGNGSDAATGLASAMLKVPPGVKRLVVSELFPGETVEFPLDELSRKSREELASCAASAVR